MNGAESLVRTLVGGGVNVCFANAGTSEMHFVGALNPVECIRYRTGHADFPASGSRMRTARSF